MLSDMTSLSSLVQQAPALAVAILALLFGVWSHRQRGRALKEAEDRQALSNVRQGRRLGRLGKGVMLLDMRRRITEQELVQQGVRLSPWPSDGPLPYYDDDDPDDDEDQAYEADADLNTAHLETQYFVPPPPAPRRTP